MQYIVKAKYTVEGKEYTATLNSYDPAYKVGGDVAIKYDPNNPEKMTSGLGIGIAVMIIGAALLAVVIFLTVMKKVPVKKLKETNGELTYAPSVKGEERELYFLTDVGTIKGGHHLEDKNRRVLYEAKMTKVSPLSVFAFDFIDHENNKTTKHLVGHAEEMDWNSILIDNNYAFTIDGQDVWKHLRAVGVTIDSRFGQAQGVMPSYTIRKDGEVSGDKEEMDSITVVSNGGLLVKATNTGMYANWNTGEKKEWQRFNGTYTVEYDADGIAALASGVFRAGPSGLQNKFAVTKENGRVTEAIVLIPNNETGGYDEFSKFTFEYADTEISDSRYAMMINSFLLGEANSYYRYLWY